MRWTLSVKIALGIAAILIAAMSASVILNVIFVRNQLMADNRHYAIHLSEVAEAGLENAMIIKDPEKIKSIMQSIGSSADIVGVAVFNKRGEIKYSINPGDVGRTFSKNDPMCIICHGGTLSDQTQTVILPSKQGARILKVVRPIINQPNCQGCHRERVLGMLMVDLSLAEVDQQATAVLGQQFRQSLATVLIVIIALIGFMHLIVTRPLAHFVRITRAIDNGDLDKRVNLTHKDEIGELGASFDRMVESMAARTQELERLNEIAATQITERKRAEEVMQESEERYRSLVELSPEAVVVHSEGKITYINKSGEKIFGASDPGEMIGKPIKDFVHPDYWERVNERVNQVQKKNEPAPLQELVFNRLNGESMNVETAGVPITFSGKIASLTIVRDITDRKRAEQEIAIIAEIGRVIGSTLDINEVYERFAAEARKLIPFDRLAVNLHDLDQGIVSIVYSSGENIAGRRPGDSFPLKDSVSEVLVRTKTGIFSHPSSIEAMDKQFPNHSATIQAGMRSLLSVPLISRDKVIASLHFRSKKPNAYTDRDLRLAERIGEQIAGAIANAQLFNDLIKTEKSLRESEEEQRLLIETQPLAVFVETHGKIAYVNPAFLTLFKASSPNEVIGIRLIEFVSPELYDTIEKRRRIMTEEKCVLPPLEQNLRCMDGTFITVVSTPMPFIFQGQPAILTVLYDITERKRSEIELEKTYKLLQIHSREIEDLQAKLKEQTIRDPLTGLFNRRYLEETMGRELARASREGFPIGVVMIDIDHFKQVNDSHGHKAGDLILQAMGNLLLGVTRAGDIACRYGGEEFLLILPQASRAITAERAEEWRTGFEALRTVYGENALQATISLGIAAYPADGVTAEAVIHAADQAMFRAKALGRNRVVLS